MLSSRRQLFSTAFFALLAGSLWLHGQGKAQETPHAADNGQNTPSLKVNTRLVIVDLVAHDKKGNVVTDLEIPDIRVLEDGKEQRISSFVFQSPVRTR